ncbi:nuclear transport factor 2 family protein [Mycobacterium sp. SMC-4]|uniref:nuclear transport factor 2 family protein n=1 Tax=Mycobacterium sp. SMC-4 TaxID=2857059 RepID=UPI0021B3A2B5|nr:nuclear transport factor 2 family protein [Mycobacterium sp. SMC-4]
MSSPPEMVDLVAQAELSQAKARYCRLLDTKDWLAVAELMTEGIIVDLDAGNPSSVPIVGRENVLSAFQSSVADARTVHQVHSPEFEFVDDEARVIWAVQERVVWQNGTSLTAFGHYHDRWIRLDGHWRIVELRLEHLIMDFA